MEYIFRRSAEHGVGFWCSVLLPLSLLPLVCTFGGELYHLFLIISIWLCTFGFLNRKNFILDIITGLSLSLVTALPVSFLIWKISTSYNCFFHALVLCNITIWVYTYLWQTLVYNCPRSFTVGEAQLLSQSIILFLLSCEFSLIRKVDISVGMATFKDVSRHVICLQVLLLGCLLLIYTLYMFPALRKGKNFLALCTIALVLMLIAWSICLKGNIFMWLLKFCLKDKERIYLILFWLVCTFVSIFFVILVNWTSTSNGSTWIRKFFHLIVTSVYVPGILYDIELLRLASVIALSVLLVLEMCRILKVPILGIAIQDAFQIFLDEKDTGLLILTHIYLLIGCSCPIWLHGYYSNDHHISLFSGVISVGIGDATAALCGKSFGKHNWKDSNKTLEGSACGLVIQIIFSFYLFHYTGHSFTSNNITLLTLAVVLTTYLEAKTSQVDNLVLPLFMFSILAWIQ